MFGTLQGTHTFAHSANGQASRRTDCAVDFAQWDASQSCTSEEAWCHAGRARSRSSSREAREPQPPDPVQQAAGKKASLAAAKVTEEAAEPAAVLQGRVPLLHKGLTRQQYAALQQQRATKGPRKALAFQYPSGRSRKRACSGRTMHWKSSSL